MRIRNSMLTLAGLVLLTATALVADTGGIIGHITSGKEAFTAIKAGSTAGTNITFSFPNASNLLGTAVFETTAHPTNTRDAAYSDVVLDMGQNDATQKVRYVVLRIVKEDISDATEDGRLEVRVMVAGTETEVVQFTTNGCDIVGICDASAFTVDAAAGLDSQSAGTLLIGAVTATKVEIGDTGVLTEMQGTADVVGALTAASVAADNALSSNVTMTSTLQTNVYNIVSGVVTGVTITGP